MTSKTLDELDQLVDGWPANMPAYAAGVRAIAAELRSSDANRRERACAPLRAKLRRELQALLLSRHESERQARRDAFNEILSDVGGLAAALDAAAERLSADRRPNFESFFKAKLIWKGNDILESEFRRHERRVRPVADPHSLRPIEHRTLPGVRCNERRVLVAQVLREFSQRDPIFVTLLRGLMADMSIAEVARRTGYSRPALYRRLEEIRDWVDERSACTRAADDSGDDLLCGELVEGAEGAARPGRGATEGRTRLERGSAQGQGKVGRGSAQGPVKAGRGSAQADLRPEHRRRQGRRQP